MSKYNNMKSISISSLSEDEISQAIKEWAEGDEYMEKLLLTCRDNGVETFGCHAGSYPYIDIVVNQSNDKVRNMLHAIKTVPGAKVVIEPDGAANIIATTDWDKPTMCFSLCKRDKQSADDFFNKLSESIVREDEITSSETQTFEHMLDFYEFFVGKESDTRFYLEYVDGQYSFSANPQKDRSDLIFINTLFKEAGLTKDINAEGPSDLWNLTAKTPEEFNEKMIKCKEVIIEGWPLSLPSEIMDEMSDNAKAHFMKRKFGDSTKGKQQFEEWLKEYRESYTINETEDKNDVSELILSKGDEASLEGIKEEMKVIENSRNRELNNIKEETDELEQDNN